MAALNATIFCTLFNGPILLKFLEQTNLLGIKRGKSVPNSEAQSWPNRKTTPAMAGTAPKGHTSSR